MGYECWMGYPISIQTGHPIFISFSWMGHPISMRFSLSCSLQWLEEVLKDSKCWLERSNFGELLNSVYLKFVDKRFRPGGRFLLVSPEWVIRFWCGFRFLVAYSGWKKSWNIQNVVCNGRILVNFWIFKCAMWNSIQTGRQIFVSFS